MCRLDQKIPSRKNEGCCSKNTHTHTHKPCSLGSIPYKRISPSLPHGLRKGLKETNKPNASLWSDRCRIHIQFALPSPYHIHTIPCTPGDEYMSSPSPSIHLIHIYVHEHLCVSKLPHSLHSCLSVFCHLDSQFQRQSTNKLHFALNLKLPNTHFA